MHAAKQFRQKAFHFATLAKTAIAADEALEFRKLEQSFTKLAENEDWLNSHYDQTVHAADHDRDGDLASASGKQ
jgi:hypothetical protein